MHSSHYKQYTNKWILKYIFWKYYYVSCMIQNSCWHTGYIQLQRYTYDHIFTKYKYSLVSLVHCYLHNKGCCFSGCECAAKQALYSKLCWVCWSMSSLWQRFSIQTLKSERLRQVINTRQKILTSEDFRSHSNSDCPEKEFRQTWAERQRCLHGFHMSFREPAVASLLTAFSNNPYFVSSFG